MRRFGLAAAMAALFASSAFAVSAQAAIPVSAGFAHAMARDLGISSDQVATRLRLESRAALTERSLRVSLGDKGFGGAWFDESRGGLVVGITDAALAAEVRAAGAVPQVVKHSAAQLEGMRSSLDRAARPSADAIISWYADPMSATVTVTARPGSEKAARSFATANGVDASLVRVVTGTPADTTIDTFPATENAIYGGGRLSTPLGGFCSSGFAVQRSVAPFYGMITAGHCGFVGLPAGFQVAGGPQTEAGTFVDASFPGTDFGLVTQDNYQFEGTPFVLQQVLDYTGNAVPVDGLVEAPVGASICRSGTTSGWRCGRIRARNITVNYPDGTVFGLARADACSSPGDSGGPFLSGTQAQGVLSGNNLITCSGRGGESFFQPVRPVLQALGLSLLTRFGPQPG